jgi:chromosome segregation ATPase
VAIFDDWISTAQTGLAVLGASLTTYFVTRSRNSKLKKELATDVADIKETGFRIGWLERLVKKSEDDDRRIESLRESQLNDTRLIAKKEAECEACRERMQEVKLERDIAVEDMVKSREDVAALKEHIVVLDGQILMARVANVRLFAAMPDGLRQEMAEHLLKQEPTKP